MTYRGFTIEQHDNQYLVHAYDMYGYYWFRSIEEAKCRIDEWRETKTPSPRKVTEL